MDEQFILTLLEKFGAQTVMLLWFMFRTETAIKANTAAMEKMNTCITLFFEKKGQN